MRKILAIISFILVIIALGYTFYTLTPQTISKSKVAATQFSTIRALEHVKNIAKAPHYGGSEAHAEVKNYIFSELKTMGLTPEIQEGFTISRQGQLTKAQNVIAKIKGSGSGKSLVLLTHYDSSPHSSLGASDAGSGVATILEGVRAYLEQNKTPKNDIIICITDAEELGLNGANLFVNEHPWAKEVGLVLNFEARGSGGPSYMLLETNGSNSKLIEEFIKANPAYPATNSLAYSIYKMLPNDTDLTIFREHGDIDGYNFAFIDDHFDYHSANDTWQNLDLKTLAHQGSYLMPLLYHFAENDLTNLKSDQDVVYFNTPIFKMISYPFMWNYILLGIAIILFILLIIYAKKRDKINGGDIASGFFGFIIAMALSIGLSLGLWKLINIIYPAFQDMLHGFTYNGHLYIAASVLIAIAAFFKVYSIFDTKDQMPSIMIAPLFFWLIICGGAIFFLPGAGYFIIPVLFGLLCFFVMINQKHPLSILMVILCLPAIFILVPFIKSFPVALGLKILFASGALTTLLCVLLLPVFGYYSKKGLLGTAAFGLAILCLLISHFYASFTEERQKPNSLVYFLNQDTNKAYWATYDFVLDDWTKKYINRTNNKAKDFDQNTFDSKYNNRFNYVTNADLTTFESSLIEASFDSIQGDTRYLDICIKPKRNVQRMDIYVDKEFNFKAIQANGTQPKDFTYQDGSTYHMFTKRWSNLLLTYLVRDNEPLELRMQFHKDSMPTLVMYESSYDLLTNPAFDIPDRAKDMIPKPFVINDAITVKKTIDLTRVKVKKVVIDSTTISSETALPNE